jgi:acyl dehydratase
LPLSHGIHLTQFDGVELGQVYHTSETFGYAAMDAFAELSGDHSAIHADSMLARECGFPDRLQYGFLLASLLSRIVGCNFHRAVCASVSLDFVEPVPAGAIVNVRAEVAQIQHTMRSVALRITMSCGASKIAHGKLTTVFLPENRKEGAENVHPSST